MADQRVRKKKSFWAENKVSIIGFAILIVVIGGLFGFYGIYNWYQEKKAMLPSEKVTVATVKYKEVPYVEATAGVAATETLPPEINQGEEYEIDNLLFAYMFSSVKAQKESELQQSGTTVNKYYWANETVANDEGQEMNAKDWLVDTTIKQCEQVVLWEKYVREDNFSLSDKDKEKTRKQIDDQLQQTYGETYKTALGEGYADTEEWKNARDEIVRDSAYMSYADYIDTAIRIQTISEYTSGNPNVPSIKDEDVQTYYDENLDSEFTTHKAQHILLKTKTDDGKDLSKKKVQQKKKLAESIAKRINNGEDMNALMNKYTEDVDQEKKPNNEGIYELVEAEGNYDPDFTKYILKHKVGDKVGVVKSQYGFHIIKILDVTKKSFDDAKSTIKQNLSASLISKIVDRLDATTDEGALLPYYTRLVTSYETQAPN